MHKKEGNLPALYHNLDHLLSHPETLLPLLAKETDNGCPIPPETMEALYADASALRSASPEQQRLGLERLLLSQHPERALIQWRDIVALLIPEVIPMFDHPQYNPHHCYDVWEHTAHSVAAAPPEGMLRWTMLLHDIGKPQCFFRDDNGIGHFHGHPTVSARMADSILHRLDMNASEREDILLLISWHDRMRVMNHRTVRRMLHALGPRLAQKLPQVILADISAQAPDTQPEKRRSLETGEAILQALLSKPETFK